MWARDVREEESWYCSMFRCFSFRVLPGSSLSMNFITGWRSGSGPATLRMMVYPSPNLKKEKTDMKKGKRGTVQALIPYENISWKRTCSSGVGRCPDSGSGRSPWWPFWCTELHIPPCWGKISQVITSVRKKTHISLTWDCILILILAKNNSTTLILGYWIVQTLFVFVHYLIQ